jgi:release factor glutamine methyltransferase
MDIKSLKSDFALSLRSIYNMDEIHSFFCRIIEFKYQLKRIDIALQPNFEIPESDAKFWHNCILELQKEKPIQYILGQTWFMDLCFFVNQHTLIPRPETEELVNWVLAQKSVLKKPKVLDIGTGSGCIPVGVKKNWADAEVYAVDVSFNALNIAQKNAKLNDVNIHFSQQDILATDNLTVNFDIIISNPPYVRILEKQEIKKNVLHYEPHLALFVEDNDALLFYRKIGKLAFNNLKENGFLFFEINQYLGKETSELLHQIGFTKVILKQDIFGNDRMICCQK